MLGGRRPVIAAGPQSGAAGQSVSAICAVPLPVLCRTNLHELPVGYVPAGSWVCRASVEHRHDAGHLAVTLAAVPVHVHVGRRQAGERGSELVEPVGAVLSLFDAAAADAAGVVRGKPAARRIESRHWRHVFRRADSAVPDLLPAPAAVLRSLRHPVAAKPAFSSPGITIGSIFRPCCCACRCSTTRRCEDIAASPGLVASRAREKSGAATGGDGRGLRIGVADRVLQPGEDG